MSWSCRNFNANEWLFYRGKMTVQHTLFTGKTAEVVINLGFFKKNKTKQGRYYSSRLKGKYICVVH